MGRSEQLMSEQRRCTEVKDENGVVAYEGDTLLWSDGYKQNEYLGKVVFVDGCFMSEDRHGSRTYLKPYDSGGATTYRFSVLKKEE
jgi:hypothetical protein